MDVTMPDGTVVQGVPDGMTKSQLLAKYQKFSAPATDQSGFANNVSKDWQNRQQQVSDIESNLNAGNLNPLGATAGVASAGLGAVGDVAGEGAKSAWNAVPKIITKPIESSAEYLKNQFAQTPEGIALGIAAPIVKSEYNNFEQSSPNMAQGLNLAGNVAKTLPIASAADSGFSAIAKSAPDIVSAVKSSNPLDFLKSAASGGADVLPTPKTPKAPPIDPRTAQLVQDAQDLGINIPSRIFAPGIVSDALNKVGLMPADTMKSDVTTALSKAMGHDGTPNLDTDTISKIQSNIGKKMDSFALKADESGGIPVSKTEMNGIADQSLADDPKVAKLSQKIQDRLDENGNLSGSDYQALTKKGGILDRAMNSSDSEFADTAKKFRGHLDDQLEQTVSPDDLADFQESRRQYRTLKTVQPLVESGGITGQPDSASKIFNAVVRNYGSISNALKYNPQLGKIAQIVNEFPEAVKDTPKQSAVAKIATMATAPAALGVGAVGGIPAGLAAAAALPVAKGTAMYLGSAGRKAAILGKSLPEIVAPIESNALPQNVLTPENAAATLAPKPMPNMYSGVQAKVDKMPVWMQSERLDSLAKKAASNAGLSTSEMAEFEYLKSPKFSKGGSVRKNLTAEFLARKYK